MVWVLMNWGRGSEWIKIPERPCTDISNERREWTPKDLATLEAFVPRYGIAKTSDVLRRSIYAVEHRCRRERISWDRRPSKRKRPLADTLGKVA